MKNAKLNSKFQSLKRYFIVLEFEKFQYNFNGIFHYGGIKKDKPVLATGQGYPRKGDMRLVLQKQRLLL